MDFTSILKGLGGVAAELATFVPGGGAAVGLAHSVLSAIASAKAVTTHPVPAEATQGEAGLMAAVTKHAQSTFDRAEGKG